MGDAAQCTTQHHERHRQSCDPNAPGLSSHHRSSPSPPQCGARLEVAIETPPRPATQHRVVWHRWVGRSAQVILKCHHKPPTQDNGDGALQHLPCPVFGPVAVLGYRAMSAVMYCDAVRESRRFESCRGSSVAALFASDAVAHLNASHAVAKVHTANPLPESSW